MNWSSEMVLDIIPNIIAGLAVALILYYLQKWFRNRPNKQIRVQKRAMKRNMKSGLADLNEHITGSERNKSAGIILARFLDKKLTHIRDKNQGSRIKLTEYVWFLEESLKMCTKNMFTTSLLPPAVWHKGKYNDHYNHYLMLQNEKLDEAKENNSEFSLKRCYIVAKSDWPEEPLIDTVIMNQYNAGVKIFHCNPDDLPENEKGFIRDVAVFENESGKWILDTGNSLASKESDFVRLRVVDSESLISDFYSDLQRTLLTIGREHPWDWAAN